MKVYLKGKIMNIGVTDIIMINSLTFGHLQKGNKSPFLIKHCNKPFEKA